MNNVEVFEDFNKLLKEVHPNIHLDQRDEMLIVMAINHTFLLKQEEFKKRTDKIFDYSLEIEGLKNEIIRLKKVIETTFYLVDNLDKPIEPPKRSCIDNEFKKIKECLNS